MALAHGHDAFAAVGVQTGQHLHVLAHAADERRADEHGPQGPAGQTVDVQVGLEAVHLTAEGVAAHGGVQHAQTRLAEISRDLGEAMVGIDISTIPPAERMQERGW